MSDAVDRTLDDTIPALQAARQIKILTRAEVTEIVRKRRHHEYNIIRKSATRADFVRYAAFERELSLIMKRRAHDKKIKKPDIERTVNQTAARVNLIYSRAVKTFRHDIDLWLHYARHCIQTGSTRAAARVFAKAIAFRSDSERVWLAAIAFHFDTCADASGARTIAQRALRALPQSTSLWKEYFRLELYYLGKLVARRLAIGLNPIPTDLAKTVKSPSDNTPVVTKEASQKHNVSVSDDQDLLRGKQNAEQDLRLNPDRADITHVLQSNDIHQSESSEPEQMSSKHEDGKNKITEHAADPPSEGEQKSERENGQSPTAKLVGSDPGSIVDTSEPEAAKSDNSKADDQISEGSESFPSPSGESHSESEQKPEGVENEEKLGFWEGGVPLTVLRSAHNNIKFTAVTNAEFWDIAANTPFVPPVLLSAMFQFIVSKHPDCNVARIISIRKTWDSAYAEERRSLTNKIGEQETNIHLSTTAKVALEHQALDVVLKLKISLRPSDFRSLEEHVKSGVLACLGSFKRLVSKVVQPHKFNNVMKTLVSSLTSDEKSRIDEDEAPTRLNSKSGEQVSGWSLSKLMKKIEDTTNTFEVDAEFYEAMKQKVVVPFRTMEQDRILRLYLSREHDIGKLRDMTRAFLAVPPITMDSLRGAIDAELRIHNESEMEKRYPVQRADESVVSQLRKLFKKAISLGAASRNVDLWLLYVDFEKRIAGSGREVASVMWKATKSLSPQYREEFAERQALRSLA